MDAARYDRLYRLYEEFDAATLRQLQDLVDLFPPVDSRVALDRWQDATDHLERRKRRVREAFPADGERLATAAARATREQAFAALDLCARHGRAIDALVLDVDGTLRSAGDTDNEIPRETLHYLTELHEAGVVVVICTGQTLENVKGFTIQGLGSELVHSGDLAIVYEAGTGVFAPGHGADTKRLLYEGLDDQARDVVGAVRSRVLSEAPEPVRRGCHLQGNEFNVTLKPNFETGSDRADRVIDAALVHLLDLLGEVCTDPRTGPTYARAHYAAADPEIRAALGRHDAVPGLGVDEVPDPVRDLLGRFDVGYYRADAAELTSLELDKTAGVEAALDVLGVEEPFVLVMGDSRSDLRVMRHVEANDAGVAAAPATAATAVLEHVHHTDGLVYEPGDAGAVLRTAYVLNQFAGGSTDQT
jgi:hydroxymethylpyrimidine pyrophosphatase-like HAD family hydrolase